MQNKEYNGYYNYETWSASLHIDNDQDIYNHCLELTKELIIVITEGTDYLTMQQARRYAVSKELQDLIEGILLADDMTGFQIDALRSFLSEVNFDELADQQITHAKEVLERDEIHT